jgi:hypothetical protein
LCPNCKIHPFPHEIHISGLKCQNKTNDASELSSLVTTNDSSIKENFLRLNLIASKYQSKNTSTLESMLIFSTTDEVTNNYINHANYLIIQRALEFNSTLPCFFSHPEQIYNNIHFMMNGLYKNKTKRSERIQ